VANIFFLLIRDNFIHKHCSQPSQTPKRLSFTQILLLLFIIWYCIIKGYKVIETIGTTKYKKVKYRKYKKLIGNYVKNICI